MGIFGSKKNRKLESIYLDFHENRGNILDVKTIKLKVPFWFHIKYKTAGDGKRISNSKHIFMLAFQKTEVVDFFNKKNKALSLHTPSILYCSW